ncbi:MAG TPA: hypothetical protein VN683_09330 [Acidothermaceae bacterium]|nr:hypothetical protein [Acidothermaceae bacterium]
MLAVGDGVGADVGGDVTGGADVADREPLVTSVGIAGAELAGADGALLSCVLAGGDGWTEATAPTGLLWLEQPVAVAANATVSTVTAACDVVRITVYPLSLHPPPELYLVAVPPDLHSEPPTQAARIIECDAPQFSKPAPHIVRARFAPNTPNRGGELWF